MTDIAAGTEESAASRRGARARVDNTAALTKTRSPRGQLAAPTYDDREWPLFRVSMPRQALSSAEFAAYLKHIDDLFSRGDRFAIVIDAREAPVHSPTERQEIARRMRASHARFPHRLVAMGIVMSSPLQRGIFTAIMWLAGPTYPIRPFPSTTDAELWLNEMLRARTSSGEHARP